MQPQAKTGKDQKENLIMGNVELQYELNKESHQVSNVKMLCISWTLGRKKGDGMRAFGVRKTLKL